jgi:glutamate carboxypeptidase
MVELRSYFASQQSKMLALLQELVAIESPSDNKAAVDRMADRVAQLMVSAGGRVERFPRQQVGDLVLGLWGSEAPDASQILLLCHMDTVWPLGTLEQIPPRLEGDRFYGPGAFDMKAGMVIALTALEGLQRNGPGWPLTRRVALLCTSDEEVGSHESRELIEILAARSELVLCLEPSLPGRVMKTARKGVGNFTIRARGKAVHAGADHHKGVNAIQEMAYQIQILQALTDYEAGTTVNVGLIRGGTASNVVPAECTIEVDFRVSQEAEADRLMGVIQNLEPSLPGAELDVAGELNRPPMERNALMIAAFERAKTIAARHGFEQHEGSTGGASDANFTASLGVPTLDGLGADGDGGHALHEHVLVSSLPPQATVLAAILKEW